MVLHDIDYTVIYTRHEKYFISLNIVFTYLNILLRTSVWEFFSDEKPASFLYKLYLLGCVRVVQPKVVVTFIDNNYHFQWISRKYESAIFFAIQNGVRYRYDLTEWLPERPRNAKIISMPNLFCFGQYEIDLYHKFNHQIDNYFPIGALLGGYYSSEIMKIQKFKQNTDILYVSQWTGVATLNDPLRLEKAGLSLLEEFLRRYASEKQTKITVMTRRHRMEEIEYFNEVFDGKAIVLKKLDHQRLLNYRVMACSKVIVTFCSTAAIEALGWGKKVFFCNLSGDDNYDLPWDTFWFLKTKDYAQFKRRLDDLRGMDDDFYCRKTVDERKYLMSYPDKGPHEFIRNKIAEALEEQ